MVCWMLSIVVPCMNEEKTIPIFYKAVSEIEDGISEAIEYVFVDDAATTSGGFGSVARISKRVYNEVWGKRYFAPNL